MTKDEAYWPGGCDENGRPLLNPENDAANAARREVRIKRTMKPLQWLMMNSLNVAVHKQPLPPDAHQDSEWRDKQDEEERKC